MHFSLRRHKKSKSAESTESVAPHANANESHEHHIPDPFMHPVHLPPTSIANITLDPNNLTALYNTAPAPSPSTPPPPLPLPLPLPPPQPQTYPNSQHSPLKFEYTNYPSTSNTHVEAASNHPNHLHPSPGHVHSQSPPHSIADMVFDTTTLSALYDAREAEQGRGQERGMARVGGREVK
ncbi:hypothetical protein BDP27DRAFT_298014 [Rhodocollybia butyracea]|uniref:Uncharacterized protein n=1 Tax=Rhodocollybia butyracea TaxID=206335 RepID=A0A9P5Q3C9_9AGAR|nr:hypothetical protein BDP27DRAFT_298014 [Rhodocollybia butyracea]